MGVEKKVLKGGAGGYVGGFLHLFDWNAKSRKKLFSTKCDLPEQPKQKKRNDGNLPITRFHMMDEDMISGSSIKGSSDYSCASSVTDEDGYGTKAPGVVARLMGLDSLPTSNFSDTYSNPSFDSQSLRDCSVPYVRKDLEFQQKDHQMEILPSNHRAIEPRPHKMMPGRAIEKFQTEMLPPKSAKSIPVTHHKLLSPIKSSGFISSNNPAHIMEAASKIPLVGSSSSASSSSVSLKVRDLREKAENSAKRAFKNSESSRKPVESNAAKNLKGQSMNKSWNGSLEPKTFRVLEEEGSSICSNNKGKKSISLALQAKANVKKREGLTVGGGRSSFSHREDSDSAQSGKSEQNTQRSTHKKPSTNNSSTSVLRQNNQKQNCLVDRGKSGSKSSASSTDTQSRKPVSQKSSSKISGNSKANIKKQVPYSTTNSTINRRKRSIEDGDFHHVEKNGVLGKSDRSGNAIQSNGMDVVSFTFTAPIARSTPSNGIFADNRGKKVLVNFDGNISSSKSTSLSCNVIGGDALGTLLEQKLRELTGNASVFQDSCPAYRAGNCTTPIFQDKRTRERIKTDDLGSRFSSPDPLGLRRKQFQPQGVEETSESSSNDYEYRKFLQGRHPSPISVLEPFITESCNSSDTADSNSIEGCKQTSSSVLAQELAGAGFSKKSYMMDIDTELSDSASSTSAKPVMVGSTKWEQDYVKEVLSDIESMFENFTLGRAQKIINPRLFDKLESRRPVLETQKELKLKRKVVFDCVSECMDSRCRVWPKGLADVRRKDRLAADVYKEISGWEEMKDCMVDELVDKDMSAGQYGKWLDFEAEALDLGVEIECRLLNSLINEVVAYILVL